MIKSIDAYLDLLKAELAGSDRATIQDALADAEEHLRSALDSALEAGASKEEALPPIIEEYGSPGEIATAYKEIESLIRPALAQPEHVNGRSYIARFFGVLADPRAWGALLYMIFSLITGILYFTWAVTGLSLALGLMILIIGVPFAVLFLLSVQGIGLVEGRIVEALLGVRMPRRSAFFSKELASWEQLKALVVGRRTWSSLVYMLIQLPLGILYFTVFITLIATALSFVLSPLLGPVFDQPVIDLGDEVYHISFWFTPVLSLGGMMLMTATMHLARYAGRAHGALAKVMLVRD